MKKIILVTIALIIGAFAFVGCSYVFNETIDENMTVEDYAWQFIDKEIEMYENDQYSGFKVIDKKITNLEQLSTFDDILPNSVELWRLEYRLKPENIDQVMIAGGMQVEDGWITEDSSMGKPNLVFTYEDDKLVYLGNIISHDIYGLDTLASQEACIREMLENQRLLAKVTYEGNHIVIKFPLSTGETSQLLLSQPVIQGENGLWVVERWMDGSGIIYHEVPYYEEDIKILEYYEGLQEKVNNGDNLWIDPLEVGYDYIVNTLGQVLVKADDLEVINPATIDDFLTTPISHFIGYITEMNSSNGLFHLDKVEFLTHEDEERAAELDIDINIDMPSGFYIYNKDNYPMVFEVCGETEFLILDLNDLSNHISISKKEFIEFNNSRGNSTLFHIYTRDGYVTSIIEQYLP
ncbi:MAG: hypothetical protein PHY91_09090 [Tissierellia bacterium]|nr:hypothetical protein [Tissierellia bacterium]